MHNTFSASTHPITHTVEHSQNHFTSLCSNTQQLQAKSEPSVHSLLKPISPTARNNLSPTNYKLTMEHIPDIDDMEIGHINQIHDIGDITGIDINFNTLGDVDDRSTTAPITATTTTTTTATTTNTAITASTNTMSANGDSALNNQEHGKMEDNEGNDGDGNHQHTEYVNHNDRIRNSEDVRIGEEKHEMQDDGEDGGVNSLEEMHEIPMGMDIGNQHIGVDDDEEEGDDGIGEEEEEEEEDDEDDEDDEEGEGAFDDDLDDELGEPSGAFANVGQGLVGKYKNLMMQYWQNTIDSIERDEHDFKNHQLPLARIKKVMKTDEEVKMISAEAPILFAKGCDIFITELTMRAWIHAEENKRRTLQKSDIAAALQKSDMFDFLIDIVPREEEKRKKSQFGASLEQDMEDQSQQPQQQSQQQKQESAPEEVNDYEEYQQVPQQQGYFQQGFQTDGSTQAQYYQQ